jgi:hypothetical protein
MITIGFERSCDRIRRLFTHNQIVAECHKYRLSAILDRRMKGPLRGPTLQPISQLHQPSLGQRGYLAENRRAHFLVASRLSRDWIKPRMIELGEE